jgi:hypothetical protein
MKEFGLAAYGVSGKWEISLHQAIDSPESYSITFNGPEIELSVFISGIKILTEVLSFLERSKGKKHFEEIEIGHDSATSVKIIKDDEFSDRYYINLASSENRLIITLWDKDIDQIILALTQLIDDLSCFKL